jgi:DNA-binding NtrC family response regulator
MSKNNPKVLLIDDEEEILLNYSLFLRYAGIEPVETLQDSRSVMQVIEEHNIGVIVLDLIMPHISGNELLKKIRREFPHIPVIVMTAVNEIEIAVECMKEGAFDYLLKPVEKSRFVSSVKRALDYRDLRDEVTNLRHHILADDVEHKDAFSEIITISSKMKSIFRYVEAIAKTKNPVCITGETGVGKELLAKAIYKLSGLEGRFIPVNIAGLDDTMFSDTLFGHKKGAFSGAEYDREGIIAQASAGVLLLDEIGDLKESSQVKLLRLLEDKKYYPLGSDVPKKSDARIIACSNKDLKKAVEKGEFRKDLYYRLSGHFIYVPPLRERTEDIPLLFDYFIEQASNSLSKKRPAYSPEVLSFLSGYYFPGNVRELQTMVYDIVARHDSDTLTVENFKSLFNEKGITDKAMSFGHVYESIILPEIHGRFPTLKEIEDFIISEAMKRANGKQGIAASLLGISRQALNRRLLKKSRNT